jgi:hypothetical protein
MPWSFPPWRRRGGGSVRLEQLPGPSAAPGHHVVFSTEVGASIRGVKSSWMRPPGAAQAVTTSRRVIVAIGVL